MKNINKIIEVLEIETKRYLNAAMGYNEIYSDPYRVLIGCLISLRTKDKVTIEASKRLFSLARTPKEMVRLSEKQIEEAIKPSNYYKTKAKRIKEISEFLLKNYGGKVPNKLEELLKLKGVGRKTANIVLSYGFDKHAIAVDTHVHRISNRLGLVKTKTPKETEEELMRILPKKYWKRFNTLLVIWGQNVCKPVKPLCNSCPIYDYCDRIGVKKE
jgi:endonuclease-3